MKLGLFLRDELNKRNLKNPGYSMRSFAKFLGLSPSALSRLMNSKSKPSAATLLAIEEKLGDFKSPGDGPVETPRKSGSRSVRRLRTLKLNKDIAILDWRHMALFSLMQTYNFEPSFKWIASRLSLPETEVRAFCEELRKAKILRIQKNGQWKVEYSSIQWRTDFEQFQRISRGATELALAKFKALQSESEASSYRCHMMTFALHPRRLSEIDALLDELSERVTSAVKKDKDRTDVLQMDVLCFPLTKSSPRSTIKK